MDKEREQIERLKKEVVRVFGRSLDSPTEFESLAEEIHEKTADRISASTLKRVFGYLRSGSAPSKNTLAVLARYCGYDGWQDWCGRSGGDNTKTRRIGKASYYVAGGGALLLVLLTIFLFLFRPWVESPGTALPEAPEFSGTEEEQQKFDRILEYCTTIAVIKCDSVRLYRDSMDSRTYSAYAYNQYSRILNEMRDLCEKLCTEAFGEDETQMRIYNAQVYNICWENCMELWYEAYESSKLPSQ